MSRVQNMICPLCARMNGSNHADGCPESFPSEPAYRTGWLAARDALVLPLLERLAKAGQS